MKGTKLHLAGVLLAFATVFCWIPTLAAKDTVGKEVHDANDGTVYFPHVSYEDTNVDIAVLSRLSFAYAAAYEDPHVFDIYTITADGLNVKRLTTGGGKLPHWSPDGEQIAFIRGQDVWLMNKDAAAQQMVYDVAAGTIGEMQWSPAGDQIAFVEVIDTGVHYEQKLWILSLSTGQAIELSAEEITGQTGMVQSWRFAWSPDGTRLAVDVDQITDRPDPGLYLVSASDGSVVQDLVTDDPGDCTGFSPQWSPDGQQLAYVYRSDLYVRTIGTIEVARLSRFNPDDDNDCWGGQMMTMLLWEPDQSALLTVLCDIFSRSCHTYRIPVDPDNSVSWDSYPDSTSVSLPRGFSPDGRNILSYGHRRYPTWQPETYSVVLNRNQRILIPNLKRSETSDVEVDYDWSPVIRE